VRADVTHNSHSTFPRRLHRRARTETCPDSAHCKSRTSFRRVDPVDGPLTSAQAHGKRAKAACEQHQISQRQRTACRQDVGGDERRAASSISGLRGSRSATNSTTIRHPARRTLSRSSELRRSAGAAGRSLSAEQRQTTGCLGFAQQACVASLDLAQQAPQQVPQHGFDPPSRPFASHAPVAGATPTKAVAAISTNESSFLAGRNMGMPFNRPPNAAIILPILTHIKHSPHVLASWRAGEKPSAQFSSLVATGGMPGRQRFVVCRPRRSQPTAVSLSAGLVIDRFMASPNNMIVPCFPPAFAVRFFASPYRSKWELSGLRESFSSSRKRYICNWFAYLPCSTLLNDGQELGKPQLTQPPHRGLSNKHTGHRLEAGARPISKGRV